MAELCSQTYHGQLREIAELYRSSQLTTLPRRTSPLSTDRDNRVNRTDVLACLSV